MEIPSAHGLDGPSPREAAIQSLRTTISLLERRAPDEGPVLAFDLDEVDHSLPCGGLAAGALHEIAPPGNEDMPAAFGFAAACLAGSRVAGPCLLVLSSRFARDFGRPYVHGLQGLGLSPERLMVLEADHHKGALWAIEEALRSRSVAAILAVLTQGLDLTTSRRLHLAAAASETFLLVLRPAQAEAAPAALSRWRIASAPAGRDRFGTLENPRWSVTLDRSRNGRTGSWILEWDHAAHRFRLAGTLADQTALAGAGSRSRPEPRCAS